MCQCEVLDVNVPDVYVMLYRFEWIYFNLQTVKMYEIWNMPASRINGAGLHCWLTHEQIGKTVWAIELGGGWRMRQKRTEMQKKENNAGNVTDSVNANTPETMWAVNKFAKEPGTAALALKTEHISITIKANTKCTLEAHWTLLGYI